MKLRLYVSSVLALMIRLVPRLWAQGIEADSVLRAREAALAAGDLHAILGSWPLLVMWFEAAIQVYIDGYV